MTDVSFGPWTWGVTGKAYPEAATVTETQQIGTITSTQAETSTGHLVEADGLWGWFFGSTQEGLAAQPTDCDLGPTSTQAVAGNGSITLTMYTCTAGMTVETLDTSKCTVDPGATTWTLTGSPLSEPLTWDQVTQIHGPGDSWVGLAYGDYVITPDALPDGVSEYAVKGSDNAARQDAGIALTLGADEPDVMLSIYLMPGGSSTEKGGTGSIQVNFYDCQAGMDASTFNPDDCSPAAPGFDVITLTPGPGVDRNALPGGPIFRVIDGTNLGNGAFVIENLPYGTYELGPGNNYSGAPFYSQGLQAIGPDGPIPSTYSVTISAGFPNIVILMYRLGRGIG